jgi:hypothetical protein
MRHTFCFADEPEPWLEDPWDAFLADDDERDPQPEYGDFWPEEDIDGLSPATWKHREVPPCCH